MQNRLVGIAIGMTVLFGLYLCRLGLIELWPYAVNGHSVPVSEKAVAQRHSGLTIDTGRGDFVDKSGISLTGESIHALALFPVQTGERGDAKQIERLAAILGIPQQQLQSRLNSLREPAYWTLEGTAHPMALSPEQLRQLSSVHLNGVRVVPYRLRYLAPYLASHTLGFVSQHPEIIKSAYGHEYATGAMRLDSVIGGAGLERSLDRLLRGGEETEISYYLDAAGEPLHGLDLRVLSPVNPRYPLTVVTTLDSRLQQAIESYADKEGLAQGAVVVLDIRNGDIVSIVSRPRLNPEQIGLAGTDAANRAIRAAEPGSIFKLVTETAALEAGVTSPDEIFHCSGEYGRYGLSDWKKGGHGDLTLREGLAHSCNIVFAAVAERLQPQQLSASAYRLGLGRQIGWQSSRSAGPLAGPIRLLEEEEAGTLFAVSPVEVDGGMMAQTGIGQRDVRITPLQAANMIATIVNLGHVKEPRIVSEIRYANGQLFAALPPHEAPSPLGRISPAAARELMRGMELVVQSGTGRSIQAGLWQAAGKSGTAEVIREGGKRVNQWFIGYGPIQSPKYAVAVLADNRPPNSANMATKLFRGILDIAAKQQKTAGGE